MPYIIQQDRDFLPAANSGKLCYQITRLCQDYMNRKGESYDRYGEIRNALESAWAAHFHQQFVRYERNKKELNGDIS